MRSKISNALENVRFAISSMHLKLRGEFKEDYMKVRESKVGTGLQDG